MFIAYVHRSPHALKTDLTYKGSTIYIQYYKNGKQFAQYVIEMLKDKDDARTCRERKKSKRHSLVLMGILFTYISINTYVCIYTKNKHPYIGQFP